MAIVSAWNASANTIDATYAPGGKTGKTFLTGGTIGIVVDATAISGRALELTNASHTKAATWTARRNSSANRGQAFGVRMSPGYTGSPASRKVIFSLVGICGRLRVEVHHETSGQISLTMTNEAFTTIVNAASMGAWSPTSGNWYDICWSTPGDTTANGTKITIDSSVLGSTTPSAALTSSWSYEFFSEISLGASDLSAGAALQKYEEWFWYDTNVDFTANVALASGNGLLNGASRTSLVSNTAGQALTVLDGYNSTDPGIANVKSGTSYYILGTQYTGTMSASGGSTHSSSFNWSN